MALKLLLIAMAGGLGTLARYALGGAVQRVAGAGFPWGTVVVNALGCFAFGVIWAIGSERFAVGSETRTIVLVGFMGAFTTFSTFISETSELLSAGQYAWAAGNLALQNAAGIGLLIAGIAVGRSV